MGKRHVYFISKMADGNTEGEVKGQFMFCTICRLNHDQGRKHIYSRKHKTLLGKILIKFGKKVCDLRINRRLFFDTSSLKVPGEGGGGGLPYESGGNAGRLA